MRPGRRPRSVRVVRDGWRQCAADVRCLGSAARDALVGVVLLLATLGLLLLAAVSARLAGRPLARVVAASHALLDRRRAAARPPVPAAARAASLRARPRDISWREMAWLASPTAGLTTLLLLDMFAASGYGILMPVFWALSSHHSVGYQWVKLTSLSLAFFAIPVGIGFAVLAFALVGPALRLEDRRAWWLLAPSEVARLSARVRHLSEERSQAVHASADELRRIERDLHDGAQAQLVSVAMHLGMVDEMFERDPVAARAMLARARAGAGEAMTDLRDLIRGIVPPVLAERGVAGAVEALAARTAVPVELHLAVERRLPAPVESAMYFTALELVANAVRHSGATCLSIAFRERDGDLVLCVADDGCGGADPIRGTGLDGINRRLIPLDGGLQIDSPVGGPTRAVARIPCASS